MSMGYIPLSLAAVVHDHLVGVNFSVFVSPPSQPSPPPPHSRRHFASSHGAPSRPCPQESSKKEVLRVCSQMDELMEEAKEGAANDNQGPSRRR